MFGKMCSSASDRKSLVGSSKLPFLFLFQLGPIPVYSGDFRDSFLSHWGQFKLLYDAEPVEQNGWVESIFTDDWGIATLSGPQQEKLVRR